MALTHERPQAMCDGEEVISLPGSTVIPATPVEEGSAGAEALDAAEEGVGVGDGVGNAVGLSDTFEHPQNNENTATSDGQVRLLLFVPPLRVHLFDVRLQETALLSKKERKLIDKENRKLKV